MPNSETPEPISVTLELSVGNLRIAPSDRTDTVVEVRPSDAMGNLDIGIAEARPPGLRSTPDTGTCATCCRTPPGRTGQT
jgi:hypothetical protein